MQLFSFALLAAAEISIAMAAGHGHKKRAAANVYLADSTADVFKAQEKAHIRPRDESSNANGYQILPKKASTAQCQLALQRIVTQPRNCAEKYMSAAARNVYLPIYKWITDPSQAANLYATNNGVMVTVYDAFYIEVAKVSSTGAVLALTNPPTTMLFGHDRTWALNHPSFIRREDTGNSAIIQLVYNAAGEQMTVKIEKPTNSLPVIC